MLRALFEFVLPVALVVWALVDCITTGEPDVRYLPKVLWVILILLFPVVGSLVWLFAGKDRSQMRTTGRSSFGGTQRSTTYASGPLAPDDDPHFLERLRLQKWEQDLKARETKAREERDGEGPAPKA